jgi:hypothetical protein
MTRSEKAAAVAAAAAEENRVHFNSAATVPRHKAVQCDMPWLSHRTGPFFDPERVEQIKATASQSVRHTRGVGSPNAHVLTYTSPSPPLTTDVAPHDETRSRQMVDEMR